MLSKEVVLNSFYCFQGSAAKTKVVMLRAGHNFRFPLISPLTVDPLVNGIELIFHSENDNLTEECLFLSLFTTSALKIRFCRIC
jgi:hypothetical protein